VVFPVNSDFEEVQIMHLTISLVTVLPVAVTPYQTHRYYAACTTVLRLSRMHEILTILTNVCNCQSVCHAAAPHAVYATCHMCGFIQCSLQQMPLASCCLTLSAYESLAVVCGQQNDGLQYK